LAVAQQPHPSLATRQLLSSFSKQLRPPFPPAAARAGSLLLPQVTVPEVAEGRRSLWEADGKKGAEGSVGGGNLEEFIGLWPLNDKLGEHVCCSVISSSGNEQG